MELLEQVAESTQDGRVLNDLAAAYLVQAERTDQPGALAKALDAAERAVRREPRLPEALFNRALALQGLHLDQAAAAAWDDYAALETDPAWKGESATHRNRLNLIPAKDAWERARRQLGAPPLEDPEADAELLNGLIDGRRTTVRQWVERDLMAEWGRAVEEGDTAGAGRLLTTARRVIRTLSALQNDPLLLQSLEVVEAAERRPDGGRLRTLLAHGHRRFNEAHALLEQLLLDDAKKAFLASLQALEKGGSPFRWKAELGLAVCEFQSNDLEQALQRLRRVARAAGPSPPLLARAAWLRALCHNWTAQPLLALRDYRDSLQFYEAAGDLEGQANVAARLAELLNHVGEIDGAWRHRYKALAGLRTLLEPSRIHFVLGEAATATSEMNLPWAALLIQQQALDASLQADDPANPAAGHLNLAAANWKAGLAREAEKDLALAFDHARRLRDPRIQGSVESAIRGVEGLLWMDSDPARAAQSLTEAIRLAEADDVTLLPKLYALRAAANRAAGNGGAAEGDLRAAVAATEEEWRQSLRTRDEIREPSVWPVYFDQDQGIFGQLIEGLAAGGRIEEAFEVAERARARELLDLLGGRTLSSDRRRFLKGRVDPRTAAQIQLETPPRTLLIEYRVIQERLLIWVVSREKIEFFQPAESVRQIRSWVDRLYRNITRGFDPGEVAHLLRRLHQALIPEPVRGTDSRLVFVPDGPIHGVPFSALLDPETNRHLVQDHVIGIAPSASLYLVALQRNRELAKTQAESVLLVSDPAFDATLFPELPRLPAAHRETEAAARHYRTSLLLEGEKATREAVLRELGRFSVVHFSGHAIPNFRESYKSTLALAPQGSDEGALRAFELMQRDFDQTRLVVLSACSTAGGHPIGSLGVSSLVRPFMGGGVPAVVASLWAIRDSAPSRLFSAFHQNFTAGENASTALRNAQLEIIEDGADAVTSLRSWAAFQVIGEASPSKETTPWDSH